MTMCTNCGAEAEGGSTCPRCGAALPADRSARALALASAIIGTACGLAAAVDLIVDYAANGAFGWSRIGLASSVLGWLLVGFPMLTYRRPALFLPVMGAAILAYLWILDTLTGSSGWFLGLALPIALTAMVSGTLATLLCLKARRRGPNVGAFILFGCTLACLGLDGILSLHSLGSIRLTWSGIVAAANLPVAALLLSLQGRLRPRDPEGKPPQPSLANSSSR
jgi:hypothetical protein